MKQCKWSDRDMCINVYSKSYNSHQPFPSVQLYFTWWTRSVFHSAIINLVRFAKSEKIQPVYIPFAYLLNQSLANVVRHRYIFQYTN